MITLTKTYRIWWEWYTLNIQNDYEENYSGSITKITDPNSNYGSFESDIYQDVLDKISELGLRPIGDWLDPNNTNI
jgi:hypothetical protein